MPKNSEEYGEEERYLTNNIHYKRFSHRTSVVLWSRKFFNIFIRERTKFDFERTENGNIKTRHRDWDTTSKKQQAATSCLNGIENASNALWENADAVKKAETSVAK